MARSEPVVLDVTLDRGSSVPLWHQLSQAIETAISTEKLVPGDRLENEISLTRRLGLARPTVRQAIQELVRKGLVVRQQGVGTQVLHTRRSRDVRLMSLYDDLSRGGHKPASRLLEWAIVSLDEPTRARLGGIDTSQPFLHVRRLRLVDDTPLAILDNLIPASFGLAAEAVAQHGLYGAMRALGLVPKVAHQTVGARRLSAEEAELFHEEPGGPALTVQRTASDSSGRLLEYGRHVYRASEYSIDLNIVD
jgi:GntR family transcriptional regulator